MGEQPAAAASYLCTAPVPTEGWGQRLGDANQPCLVPSPAEMLCSRARGGAGPLFVWGRGLLSQVRGVLCTDGVGRDVPAAVAPQTSFS